MSETVQHERLLEFFKALADANRLKIVGLLAQEPRTVEDLAALLEVESSTVSHHLRKLSRAELVEARAEGYYSVYSLKLDRLQEMAQDLLSEETLPRFAEDVDKSAFERKVLNTFLDEEGRIANFPSQQKKYKVLLRYLLEAFEPEREYSEAQVNEMLSEFNDDTARLRRSLVDYGYMAREGGGGAYWRVA